MVVFETVDMLADSEASQAHTLSTRGYFGSDQHG